MNTLDDTLTYNTSRKEIIITEYGRNVQQMIEHLKSIENNEDRNLAANQIINVMSALNPSIKENSEFKHKLWDHLFYIAGNDLNVDSPFPKPDLEKVVEPVTPITYPKNTNYLRYYGKHVIEMLNKAIELEDGDTKDHYLALIASYMKMTYRVWNDDKISDDVIIKHIKELSKGKIIIDKILELHPAQDNKAPTKSKNVKRKKKKKKPNQAGNQN